MCRVESGRPGRSLSAGRGQGRLSLPDIGSMSTLATPIFHPPMMDCYIIFLIGRYIVLHVYFTYIERMGEIFSCSSSQQPTELLIPLGSCLFIIPNRINSSADCCENHGGHQEMA